jgi:hypothetical protein
VNAFKRLGTAVYSTHYPNGMPLWYHVGTAPARLDYEPAVQLYN